MNILITAATDFELMPLLKFFNQQASLLPMQKYRANWSIGKQQYIYNQNRIDIFVTGVGLMHTAFHLGNVLTVATHYDIAFNIGIAGSFDKKLAIGEVVQAVSQQIADMGVDAPTGFVPLKNLDFVDEHAFPYQNGVLYNKHNIKKGAIGSLKTVNSITLNKVTGTNAVRDQLYALFRPDIESMEGAAFFYACLLHQIPFCELRGISNYVENRNKANWDIPLAIERVNAVLIDWLETQ